MKRTVTAGIDEVGRGPLAGPVVAAAACFTTSHTRSKISLAGLKLHGVKDSKKLSAKQREEYYQMFLKHPQIQWGIGKASEKVIDRINIHQATKLAMARAVQALQCKLKETKFTLVIDGTFTIDSPLPQKAIIKADETVLVCSIASIIAKVTRDRAMVRYHKQYPRYGFDQHKGYGTQHHVKMLKRYGPCAIHRTTFAPIRLS